MPRRFVIPLALDALIAAQDGVIHIDQALSHGMSADAFRYRIRSGQWQRLLSGVALAQTGAPSRRQLMVAASLFAGPEVAIDDSDACRFHGVRAVGVDDEHVHVLVPWGSAARSTGFVVVRRTLSPIKVVATDRLRYVDAATAVIAATRRMSNERNVLAGLSDALQRRVTTYENLVAAHVQGPPRNSRLADDALEHLGAGTRSVPEADFRRLVRASPILPEVEYHVWLRLPCGRVVCVDALIESSAVIHETNGRSVHAREDLFEDMQVRHDVLTATGFTVLHNPGRRVRLRGREVIAQVERCHELYVGRGMPAGVQRLSMAA